MPVSGVRTATRDGHRFALGLVVAIAVGLLAAYAALAGAPIGSDEAVAALVEELHYIFFEHLKSYKRVSQ